MTLISELGFNNRELALAIWILIFSIVLSTKKEVRTSFGNVLKTFFKPVILVPFAIFLIYIFAIIFRLWRLGLWGLSNTDVTTIWFLSVGFVLFIRVNKAVESLMNAVLAIAGLGLLVYASYMLVTSFNSLLTLNELRAYLIPSILTIFSLPVVYILALYLAYDRIFRLLGYFSNNSSTRADYVTLLVHFNINLEELRNWQRYVARSRADGTVNIRENIREYLASRKDRDKTMKEFQRRELMGNIRRKAKALAPLTIRLLLAFAILLVGLGMANVFWRISEPIVFWTALQAIVVTAASVTIILEVQSLKGTKLEREARGFVMFSENFMGQQFLRQVEWLGGVNSQEPENRARFFDEAAKTVLLKLELAQRFINRGLIDRDLFFLTYLDGLANAAFSIRHLMHHPKKMPWLVEYKDQYKNSLNLLREFEDWRADREGTEHYND